MLITPPVIVRSPLESIRGEDGMSITNASIDNQGHLILTLSDLSTKDVGQVIGNDGREVELRCF